MPELDYAVLGDYVRAEQGVAHVMAAGIDTIYAPSVPTGQNLGLAARFTFTRNECGRPHRIEIPFQGEDGDRLALLSVVVTPEWSPDLPIHWSKGGLVALNFAVPLPRYGLYSFEILVNDQSHKTMPLRVLRPEAAEPQPELPEQAEG